MSPARYLTKSRFKLALDCPTKLYYTAKDTLYKNQRNNDPFLVALSDGGFQVEELARLAYPEGILIQSVPGAYDTELAETEALLKQENCVIFEAAFRYENLFVRTDILIKRGAIIELIEVKAKSILLSKWLDKPFLGKQGGIDSGWKPYLFDVAFQAYVVQKSLPSFKVKPFMQLVDKSKKAKVNNLNQYFRFSKSGEKRKDTVRLVNCLEEIGGENLLTNIDVAEIVEGIINGKYFYNEELTKDFGELIQNFANAYRKDEKIITPLKFSACKTCEFKNYHQNDLKSGFHECWKEKMKWGNREFEEPNLMEVWNFVIGNKLFKETGLIFMKDLNKEIYPIALDANKISRTERQWLQIEKTLEKDNSIFVMKKELKNEITSWDFPLHFIDFETSTVAIPFNENRMPYEQIAFQFSHHKVTKDRIISHETEYINTEAGIFPNFEFVRALKNAVGKVGTIFRYSNHENTVLNQIRTQLIDSQELDKEGLIKFIEHITKRKEESFEGDRCMVDLCEIYKSYYFDPNTKGSNSIKAVLPAMLRRSQFLQQKYCRPLSEINVSSKNFPGYHTWLKVKDGFIQDPYKMLPPVFEDWSNEELEQLSNIEDLNNGGAALTAYGFMQYTEMSFDERKALSRALKKYCELDTLAMVMIYECFLEVVNV
jgi:hypothetical protein